MDREGFRNRLKQYKQAREENPGLKYWEWKDIPKYDEGGEVTVPTEEEFLKTKKKNLNDYELKNFDPWIRFFGENEHILNEIRKRTNEDAFTQKRRFAIAEKYTAPFIKDKEIVLTNSGNLTGAKLSENLLDSLYKYSDVVGIPVQDAIGLAAQETTFGKFYGLMDPKDKTSVLAATGNVETGFDPTYSLHNHSYESDAFYDPANEVYGWISKNNPNVKGDSLLHLAADEMENNPKYYINEGIRRYEKIKNPWIHAFNVYKSGKYNTGDKNHTKDVRNAGKLVMQDPAIQKWAKEKGIAFAEGGEVTGPPTYEQWNVEMNQYSPTILDDASLYWSLEAAKKDLHKQAMSLPGYAPMWHEYVRSLPKADPDINQFVDDIWANENPNNVGYRNGKYYPHKSPEGGKMTIGPGFKLDSGSHGISTKTANRGMTKTRLDQEARKIGKQHLKAVDQFINYGQTTNPADTVSPQIKMGLMDLRHQVGPLNEWGNLRQAVLEGDLDRIKKESTVTWNDNGKTKVDKRRKKIRDEKYFYYE